MNGIEKPKLIISGDSDMVAPLPELHRFFEHLREPKRLEILPDTNHFLQGVGSQIINLCKDFISGAQDGNIS